MKPTTALFTLAIALAALPAFAQKKVKAPKAAPAAAAAPTKVSGGIKTPGVSADGKFSMGSGVKATKGTWMVDASKATIADKKGATVALTALTPGSSVTVEGAIDMPGKTINATKITATHLAKAAKAPKPKKAKVGTPPVAH